MYCVHAYCIVVRRTKGSDKSPFLFLAYIGYTIGIGNTHTLVRKKADKIYIYDYNYTVIDICIA